MADPPSPALGALLRLGFFHPASFPPRPLGPLPDPGVPRPQHTDALQPSAAERACVPEAWGCHPLPHTGDIKGKQEAVGPTDPQQAGGVRCHSSAGGPTAGDFPSHQDFRRAPLLRPLRLLRNQGLGRSLLGQDGGRAGRHGRVARGAGKPILSLPRLAGAWPRHSRTRPPQALRPG